MAKSVKTGTTASAGGKQPARAANGDTRKGFNERSAQNKVELNPNNPIPYELGNNAFATLNGYQYLPFFMPKDNFAQTLLECRLLSATQNGCITTKNKYLVGQGLIITNLKDEETPDPTWAAFALKCNARGQNINRFFKKAFDSKQTFGNAPIEIVRVTVAGKKFLYIYVKNFLDCKLTKPDERTGEPEFMLFSKLFRTTGVQIDVAKMKRIPIYRMNRANDADNWLQDGPGIERTCIWVKNEIAGYDHYGLPSSISGVIYQVLEYGGARFNLDNVENNMIIGEAIFLTGGITQTEADRIGSNMVKRHTGHGKRGRVAVYASENGIDDVKVVSYDTHKEGSYKDMNELCESKIIFQNEWDAVLAGLKHTSALGKGGGYLKEAYEQKLKTVIIPEQQTMIEDVMPILVEIAKKWLNADWSRYSYGFDPIQIDNKTSEASTTVAGLLAKLDIITLVATGAYQLQAAIKLVMAHYGLSEKEAKEQLGIITVIPGINVRNKPGGQGGSDNATGGTQ